MFSPSLTGRGSCLNRHNNTDFRFYLRPVSGETEGLGLKTLADQESLLQYVSTASLVHEKSLKMVHTEMEQLGDTVS